MNLVERIREQTRSLSVCNEDLRHITDPDVRDYLKRLRKIREEGMWRIGKDWSRSGSYDGNLVYEADWAAHRLALAVGIDARLDRDNRDQQIEARDVFVLLTYLRAVQEGRNPTSEVSA